MMDSVKIADIVISTAGREKGKPFLVYEVDESRVLLVDGRYRKLENPKHKNVKHIRFAARPEDETARILRRGGQSANSAIRKVLAAFAQAQPDLL